MRRLRDDAGSLAFAMLVMLVGISLTAVIAPIATTTCLAVGAYSNIGDSRQTM